MLAFSGAALIIPVLVQLLAFTAWVVSISRSDNIKELEKANEAQVFAVVLTSIALYFFSDPTSVKLFVAAIFGMLSVMARAFNSP